MSAFDGLRSAVPTVKVTRTEPTRTGIGENSRSTVNRSNELSLRRHAAPNTTKVRANDRQIRRCQVVSGRNIIRHFARIHFTRKPRFRLQRALHPGARRRCRLLFLLALGREHVVVHRNHHGDEHDRVVEEVELDPREKQLQHAARYRLIPRNCGASSPARSAGNVRCGARTGSRTRPSTRCARLR